METPKRTVYELYSCEAPCLAGTLNAKVDERGLKVDEQGLKEYIMAS